MRYLVLGIFALLTSLVYANEVDIRTNTENGATVFYLQAGIFTQSKQANTYKDELSTALSMPVRVKQIDGKTLYMVQVGPVNDYQQARQVKAKLQDLKPGNKIALNNPAPPVPQPTAQAPAEQVVKAEQEMPDNKKLWNLRNADIRAVITEVSRITGINFLIDPRVQGKISIISSTPISDKELYQVFLSALQISGYAAIPSGNVTKVVPNIDAKSISPDRLSQMRNPARGDAMLVEVIPVTYVPAEQLVPVLRPLMPQWSSVSAYAPSNMLILSGRASNIREMATIIRQVDSSNANGIDIIPLRYVLAMDVVNTLKDIVKPQPGGGLHSQTTIAADDRSNAVLISGNKTDRIRLRMLIAKLDRRGPYGDNSTTQVVYLNYLRAEDLVPILAGVAQANFSGNVGTTIGTITHPELDSTNPSSSIANPSGSSGGFNSFNSNAGGNTGGNVSGSGASMNSAATAGTSGSSNVTEGSTKPTVQIIGEPNTNSVIINAPASIIRILKSVISQLDIRPDQILIEAMVAEIDERCVNDLGIEWGSKGQTGDVLKFRPGFAVINNKTSLSDFQAQIYALVQARKANILSTPSVMVLDNRQAKILVGKQVSVASTSYPNNAGGTTTASPFTTFNRVNVALHLYVRPQITRGDGIAMQIDQGNDTLDPSVTDTTTNPTFKISSIVTSVHVDSGDVVVLGGLTQDGLGNDDVGVPILGNIPGIGRMFQRIRNTHEKRVLLVFIKPVIMRSENQALQISGHKYNNIRQMQLDYARSFEYNPANEASVLPPLKTAELPRPFAQPVQKADK